MYNFNDSEFDRKNRKKFHKNKKSYLDEEQKDKNRSNKAFKHKKRELDDEDDWNNWKEEYR